MTLFIYEFELRDHYDSIKLFRDMAMLHDYDTLCEQSETQIDIKTLFDDAHKWNIHNYAFLLQYIVSYIHKLF